MYKISKRFEFSAAHKLIGLPLEHSCSNLHGHNYNVEIIMQSLVLDKYGFVRDYKELYELDNYLKTNFDHKNLNEILSFNPTCENIAKHLYEWCFSRWSETVAVRVSESTGSWAEYNNSKED